VAEAIAAVVGIEASYRQAVAATHRMLVIGTRSTRAVSGRRTIIRTIWVSRRIIAIISISCKWDKCRTLAGTVTGRRGMRVGGQGGPGYGAAGYGYKQGGGQAGGKGKDGAAVSPGGDGHGAESAV